MHIKEKATEKECKIEKCRSPSNNEMLYPLLDFLPSKDYTVWLIDIIKLRK